jgi:hypothetical protein
MDAPASQCGFHLAFAPTLLPDVVAATREQGKAWDLWETAAESLVELERSRNRG